MRDYEFTIPANGQDPRAVSGNFIKLKSSSSEVRIIAETRQGRIIADLRMTAGSSVKVSELFEKVRVENQTGSSINAVLILGIGDVQDNELTGTITASLGTTLQNSAVTVGTIPAQIVAANAVARSHIILNNSAGDIYIGNDATVTTLTGFKITAGQTLIIDKAPQAAIFAIGSAAGLDVRVLSEIN